MPEALDYKSRKDTYTNLSKREYKFLQLYDSIGQTLHYIMLEAKDLKHSPEEQLKKIKDYLLPIYTDVEVRDITHKIYDKENFKVG